MLYQLLAEHSPAREPSKHSYCVSLVQPLCGRHVHAGRPLGVWSYSLASALTRASLFGGSAEALPCSLGGWIGADGIHAWLFYTHLHKSGTHHAPTYAPQTCWHHESGWRAMSREVHTPLSPRW